MAKMKSIAVIILYCTICSVCGEQIPDSGIFWDAATNNEIELQVDAGYSIGVTVQTCKLSSSDESALITSSRDEGVMLLYTVPENYTFLVGTSDVRATTTNFNAEKSKLIVFFNKIEMPVTEVTYPSTTNESRLLTVYLSNKPTDFENETTLHNLKSSIAAMAEKYCSINNLVTNEDITEKNVVIIYQTYCPNTWKNYEYCTRLTFAIPIYLDETKDYQLTSTHLKYMWDTLAGTYLTEFQIYEDPDVSKLNLSWYWTVGILLTIFIILLLGLRGFILKLSEVINRRRSSTVNYQNGATSVNNLIRPPSPSMQETPELFQMPMSGGEDNPNFIMDDEEDYS
ncbi:uncharacterized protein LOC109599366 isoform X2 [Aethina tumida]|uniref:uncharacterized protein LOC109599366 isoform X2 n=1 Tax=Aethina tumida TaxID=116153 RepID=UPI00214732B4|nr:uncharacterized protein LOC109599366 isoform X2 [Aethina tumida]